jgi:hypothetical protein
VLLTSSWHRRWMGSEFVGVAGFDCVQLASAEDDLSHEGFLDGGEHIYPVLPVDVGGKIESTRPITR